MTRQPGHPKGFGPPSPGSEDLWAEARRETRPPVLDDEEVSLSTRGVVLVLLIAIQGPSMTLDGKGVAARRNLLAFLSGADLDEAAARQMIDDWLDGRPGAKDALVDRAEAGLIHQLEQADGLNRDEPSGGGEAGK